MTFGSFAAADREPTRKMAGDEPFLLPLQRGRPNLLEHEWKNASADTGGNHGDIRSS
jgi:hypothetical protein